MSDESMPAYIAERIRRAPPAECFVVPGSTPVIAFGRFRSARVATLGLNPSKNEFLDTKGRERAGALRRLETLASLGVASLADAPDSAVAQVLTGCDTYFQRNPYRRWFDQLQRILDPLGVSYDIGSATHLDLVQWATDPIWRHLGRPVIERLLHDDAAFLRQQLENEHIEVLLLNGRGVIDHVEWAFNVSLQRVPERVSGGRLATELVVGAGIGRCTIIGWSTNLQSSFGVTHALRQQLATVVAELVDASRANARKTAIARLDDQREHPSLEQRTVTLDGSTTIDGVEAPCTGHIRLKRYPKHMFAQWTINRKDGTLPGHAALTIPLGDLTGGDDIWGASVQLVLDQIRTYRVGGAPVFQIATWGWRLQSFDPGDVKQIMEWLTVAREHKGMVFGGADLERFMDWRMGFFQGVTVAGLRLDQGTNDEAWWAIARQRGWHFMAMLPWREMRTKGLSDEAIIDEILTIDIAAWKQAYQIEDATDKSS